MSWKVIDERWSGNAKSVKGHREGMKKEEEVKVQGIGSGVVGNWTTKEDATRRDPNLKPFVCLYLFVTRRVVLVDCVSCH